MGKNKKKTKTKTISLEEFSGSQNQQEDIALPTGSIGIVAGEQESSNTSDNWRTPVSKEDTFYSNRQEGEEIDWSRGHDISELPPIEQSALVSVDWRRDSETIKPSGPVAGRSIQSEDWREESEITGPTSAPIKSEADTETNWRKSAKPNKPRAYRPPITRDSWRARPTRR